MKRGKPLQADREKTRAWRERSRGLLKADEQKVREFVRRGREASQVSLGKSARDIARDPKLKATGLGLPAESVARALRTVDADLRRAGAPAKPPKRSGGRSRPRVNTKRFQSGQPACANGCDRGTVHQHHVVFEQATWREGGDISDPDNALGLCVDCHLGVAHKGKLELSRLRDENFAFAAALLGSAAHTYLRRRYAGQDPRLDELRNIEAVERPQPKQRRA